MDLSSIPLFLESSNPRVAVAVSGGADSMALALLARAHTPHVAALTVDHGLRPESAAEAAQVGQWMKERGIAHHTLPWQGPKTGNLQAAARDARYQLIGEWCQKNGVTHLLVAHHQEDQAETVLLRLKRGSHVTGLSAMQPVSKRGNLTVLRPLLSTPKAALVEYLRAQGQPWLEDPSNQNMVFDRVRARALLAALPNASDITAALAHTAERLRPLREAAQAGVQAFLRDVHMENDTATCTAEALEAAGPLALSALLHQVGGKPYPPRFSEVEALLEALTTGNARRTLAGCMVERRENRLVVQREHA